MEELKRTGKTPFDLKPNEIALAVLCLLLMMMSTAFLVSDELVQKYFGRQQAARTSPTVGEISFANNDTRLKEGSALSWNKARGNQKVRQGDSIFTGDNSTAEVVLKNGGKISLNDNTLISFTEIDGIEVPEFGLGNFNVNVNGKLKVAVNGEIVELSGKNSKVEIVVTEKKKPQFKLISGEATIKPKQKEQVVLAPQKVATIEVKKAPPPLPPRVTPDSMENAYAYTWRLYDFYDRKLDRGFRIRDVVPDQVPMPLRLSWKKQGEVPFTFFQIGRTLTLSEAPVQQVYGLSKDLTMMPLGETVWRISPDKVNWSEPQSLRVTARFAPREIPRLKMPKGDVVILDDRAEFQMQIISNDEELMGYIVESSEDARFLPNRTYAGWVSKKQFTAYFTESAFFYYRIRGVTKNSELTDYSAIQSLKVIKPTPIQAPRLADNVFRGFINEEIRLNWSGPENAKTYELKIYDENRKVVESRIVPTDHYFFKSDKVGNYRMQVWAYDKYHRKSQDSVQARIEVMPKLLPLAQEKPVERKPAQENKSVVKKDEAIVYNNRGYKDSKVAVEGSLMYMFSSEQVYNSQPAPIIAGGGVRATHWNEKLGFEASAKSKVFGFNGAGNTTKSISFEAHVMRRWNPDFNIFSSLQESQIAVVAGYENYSNSGNDAVDENGKRIEIFAPKYQLFKLGTALEFPLFSNFDTGGEILYGLGTDSSKKQEISGHIHYYVKKDFSAGVGYRVHFFDAGSLSSSPGTLPYREGYGEGYSTIRWHY